MIGILKFKLPEEEEEAFKDAQNATRVIGGLQDFDNYLRSICKHGTEIKDPQELTQEIRTKLYDYVPNIWGDE